MLEYNQITSFLTDRLNKNNIQDIIIIPLQEQAENAALVRTRIEQQELAENTGKVVIMPVVIADKTNDMGFFVFPGSNALNLKVSPLYFSCTKNFSYPSQDWAGFIDEGKFFKPGYTSYFEDLGLLTVCYTIENLVRNKIPGIVIDQLDIATNGGKVPNNIEVNSDTIIEYGKIVGLISNDFELTNENEILFVDNSAYQAAVGKLLDMLKDDPAPSLSVSVIQSNIADLSSTDKVRALEQTHQAILNSERVNYKVDRNFYQKKQSRYDGKQYTNRQFKDIGKLKKALVEIAKYNRSNKELEKYILSKDCSLASFRRSHSLSEKEALKGKSKTVKQIETIFAPNGSLFKGCKPI